MQVRKWVVLVRLVNMKESKWVVRLVDMQVNKLVVK